MSTGGTQSSAGTTPSQPTQSQSQGMGMGMGMGMGRMPNQSQSSSANANPNPFSGEYGSRLPQEYMYEAGMSQLASMPEVKQENQVFGPAPPSPLSTSTYKTPGYEADTNEASLRGGWGGAMASRGYSMADIAKSQGAQNLAAGVDSSLLANSGADFSKKDIFEVDPSQQKGIYGLGTQAGASGLEGWGGQRGTMGSYAGLAALGRQKMMGQFGQYQNQMKTTNPEIEMAKLRKGNTDDWTNNYFFSEDPSKKSVSLEDYLAPKGSWGSTDMYHQATTDYNNKYNNDNTTAYNQYAQKAFTNPNAGYGMTSFEDWLKSRG